MQELRNIRRPFHAALLSRLVRPAALGLLCLGLPAAFAAATAPAQADTLKQALAAAYLNNPELRAERARQRATDESVPQALSGWRPNVSISGDVGRTRVKTFGIGGAARNTTDPRGYGLSVSQPLFRGFRTLNNTKSAEAGVQAGREVLLNVEQNIILDAITAYLDVVRDSALLKLRGNNVSVLNEQLRSTRARFDVGELTRTDVAQARARRSGAVSQRDQASANLSTSRAVYKRIIGRAAGSLRYPRSIIAKLPRSRATAYDVALREHPGIQAALYNEQSANFAIKATKGELYPSVSLDGEYARRWEPSSTTRRSRSASITGRISIPIYQSGSVYSRVRQAKHTRSQRALELENIRNQVMAATSSAWSGLSAARAQIVSSQEQVRASRIALNGVREEAKVGQRTTLDVLDAQQELLDARVSLVVAERTATVASYSLLSAIGRLNARYLGLQVPYYDPTKNYSRVRNKWFGANTGKK